MIDDVLIVGSTKGNFVFEYVTGNGTFRISADDFFLGAELGDVDFKIGDEIILAETGVLLVRRVA